MTTGEPRPDVDGPQVGHAGAIPAHRWLHRRRLLDLLEASVASGLALVVAPLGSGKTTLLKQWAVSRDGPVRWVPPSDGAIERLSHASLRGAAVVIDDAHRLSPRATADLGRQIERTAPDTSYVIAARSLPQFNLAHFEFPVPVLVTEDDLRFGPGEIADLFGQVYGAPISKAVARDLCRATDGWAAALYLQHLSERASSLGRARSAVDSPRESMLMDRAYTWEYLTREVLAPLPPALVHFLQMTCVLEPISVRACDLLLTWDGSRRALHELTARSGLVRADPLVEGDFHYHPVLRAHLGARLAETIGNVRAQELHERAQLVHAQLAGQPSPARRETEGSGARPRGVVAWAPAWDVHQLDVRCLGGFRFRLRGVDLDLSAVRPSARTVLRILAIHAGAPVHREELVELFWPDHSLEAGIHNLHVAISSLRRCLEAVGPGGRDLLARWGNAYVLAPDGELVTDLQRLDRAVQAAASATTAGDAVARVAALRQTLALYVGDVLPADGPAEWVVEIREQVRQRVARAATELSRDELAGGDVPAALVAATRSVELDPWSDEAWRQLIDCHVTAGDHAQAARARQAYRRRLRDLGIETDDALGREGRAGLRSS